MRHTKAAVLQQFRYNWKVATLADPALKSNKIAKRIAFGEFTDMLCKNCLLYASPSPRDLSTSRMPSSA